MNPLGGRPMTGAERAWMALAGGDATYSPSDEDLDGLVAFDAISTADAITSKPPGLFHRRAADIMDRAVDRACSRGDAQLRLWTQVVLGPLLLSGHTDIAARAAAALQRLMGDAEEGA